MIIWLTGNSGSGKTTLGKLVANHYDAVPLDGDEMRATISLDAGFSAEDREAHNLRVARLAKLLDSHDFHVVVTVIAPFTATRAKIDKMLTPIWIHIYRPSLPILPDRPYEEPDNYLMSINTDEMSILEAYKEIVDTLTIIGMKTS